jgi:hypothetical protein
VPPSSDKTNSDKNQTRIIRRATVTRTKCTWSLVGLGLLSSTMLFAQGAAQPQAPPPMTFFLTSEGPGKGGDLGGLAGADAHCQMLAAAAGAGGRTWRAYLSTHGPNAVNARDRIGAGPWHNARGVLIGQNVDEMHGMAHRFNSSRMLDQQGRMIPNGDYVPNRHDILTGSQLNGTAFPAGDDMTCNNWTSSTTGKARVGHHDRAAWNSAHDSQGCTQTQLRGSGGDGLFYCFAAQ